jgi:acyl-coenzyme A thioesterase PaaI-like protein
VAVQVSNFVKPSSEGDVLTAEASKVTEGKTFSLYNVTVTKENKVLALFTGLAYKLQPEKIERSTLTSNLKPQRTHNKRFQE